MLPPSLPLDLAPPAPFPAVTQTLASSEFVAPGVRRTTYDLQTVAGPLRVRIVEADPQERTLRIGVVTAADRLVSVGETLSSMARRTHAIAGVNADYFDIGATNQPLNLVVRDGTLVRTPSQRVTLTVGRDGRVRFGPASFAGSVGYGATTLPLTQINQWPPEGGVAFVTPAFGARGAAPGVTEVALDPEAPADANGFGGTYRVRAVGAARSGVAAGPTLGFGPAALALGAPPAVGDDVTIAGNLLPSLASVTAGVGGGPLLVADGAVADDPHAPAPEERDRRFPVSGAATLADGSLLLVAVDGRRPAQSIGLTRPEFAALLLGLGATDGMAFDSGGSAEIVWRELGDPEASVRNNPSDGEERRIADGLFLYSDAPAGPASRLVLRPARIVALPRAVAPVRAFAVDAAGHALGERTLDGGDTIAGATAPGQERRVVRAGGLSATIPVRTVAHVAALRVEPERSVVSPGQPLALVARGLDASGEEVALGDAVTWRATRGAVDATGRYRAAGRDAAVTATAGGADGTARVLVGRHESPLALFGDTQRFAFASAPAGLAGTISRAGDALALGFGLGPAGRAAYADLLPGSFLPGEPEAFSVEIDGDGSGAGVRAAFANRFGERQALTLAPRVDWRGPRRVRLVFPPDLNPPVTLLSLYVVRPLDGGSPIAAPHGTIVFRSPAVTLPGTP